MSYTPKDYRDQNQDPYEGVTFACYDPATGMVLKTGETSRMSLDYTMHHDATWAYLVGVPINPDVRYRVDLTTLTLIEVGAFDDADFGSTHGPDGPNSDTATEA